MRISTGLDIEETKLTRGIIAYCLWTPWPVSGRGGWTRVQRFQFVLHRVNVLDQRRTRVEDEAEARKWKRRKYSYFPPQDTDLRMQWSHCHGNVFIHVGATWSKQLTLVNWQD